MGKPNVSDKRNYSIYYDSQYMINKTFTLCLITICFLSIFSLETTAQFRQNHFGKNRVQYKRMEWNYISTTNFDIYFYDGGYDLAKLAAEYAEKDFDRITDLVGFSPYNKTKILIYNSIIDLQQSNIGVYDQGYDVGGQTNFVRSEIELAFTGSKANFKNELALGISDILIFEMMYGGNLKEIFQNSYLLNLPEWFMAGAATYIAEGWSVDMDDYLRDALSKKKMKKITNLEGEDAKLIGQSIWNYIAEEYGKSNIANVLNLTRIVRNEEQSIQQTLGIPFKTFIKGWKAYYDKQFNSIKEGHERPDDEQLLDKNKREKIYHQLKISPDGRYLAYTENIRGRYKVKLLNLEKNKESVVLKGGYKLINQRVDEEMPLISWRDRNELGIFGAKNGKVFLWFYELKKKGNKRTEKRNFKSFSNIKSFDISSDGNYMTLSAEWRGKNNLYIYNYRDRKLTQITNDPFDYMDASYLPGKDRKIVFSSNRPDDSISVIKAVKEEEITNNFNIFLYDPEKPNTLTRLTNTLSKDVMPKAISEKEVLFLSDQRGISQMYKYDMEDSVSIQLTNYQTSIKTYDVRKNDMFAVMLHKSNEHIIHDKNFQDDVSTFTGKTYRQQIFDLRNLQELKRKRQEEERARKLKEEKERKEQEEAEMLKRIQDRAKAIQDSINRINSLEVVDSTMLEVQDSLEQKLENLTDTLQNEDLQEISVKEDSITHDDEIEQIVSNATDSTQTDVDTDDYQFDTFSKGKRKSFLDKYRTKIEEQQEEEEEEFKISRSLPYEKQFAADNFVTSVKIDPQRGWGLLFEVAMTDVLENHKINAGIFYVTNLNNSNLFAEYEYLKTRLDYRARFERRNLEVPTESATEKYNMNLFQGSVSYPFNITSRISFEPFFATTRFTTTDINLLSEPDVVTNYTGFNTEFIYDNSIITGVNMMEGTRLKIKYENYIGLGENGKNRSFGQFYVDLRNYQKIHRSLIFATRLAYGQFTGKAKKEYLLGGVDNWLFNKFDTEVGEVVQENSDRMFINFATSMRGFKYNKLSGNNVILLNAELRFPLLKYFYKGTITSNFFRNLQLVGFTDVGSAWTGVSPFNRENALNTEVIESVNSEGGFIATVKNFKNPFLIGYGAGIRTMLLGYYTKFDVAWGIEDDSRQDPMFYFTLGHDF
ncbi:MAG: translocation protein TolB [Thalassobius sp.]|nr:translocation protein TolB [Thalassovita sp.]